MGLVYVCAGSGKVISYLSQRIWVLVREVYNHSTVLLSILVPLYVGLGVKAPARTDFLTGSSRSSSFLILLPVVHFLKTGSQ